MMLYRFVYWLMRLSLRVYYRSIQVQGLSQLPKTGPVILYANHPGSALDAFLLGVFIQRPIHFFARADMFTHPWGAYLMRKLHMHPVQHHESGRSSLHQNDDTIQKALELLQAGEVILFFPEGSSHTDYHALPFRKGVFRIALQWQKQNPSADIYAFPVGINYEHPTKARTLVNIKGGNPFLIAPFQVENDAIALRNLSLHAHAQLLPLIVHHPQPDINHRAATELSQQRWIETKNRSNWFLDSYQDNIHGLTMVQESAIPWKQRWLDKQDLRWLYQLPQQKTGWYFWLITPLAWFGRLLNGLPIEMANRIAYKKVYREDFFAWIRLACGAVFYLLWWLMCTLIAFLFLPIVIAWIVPCSLIITGTIWIWWQDRWETRQRKLAIEAYPNTTPPV
jgi:1-acyl-sn-glycerol-3-phosphate acyltransferase